MPDSGACGDYWVTTDKYVPPKPQMTFFVGTCGVCRGEPLGDRQVHIECSVSCASSWGGSIAAAMVDPGCMTCAIASP